MANETPKGRPYLVTSDEDGNAQICRLVRAVSPTQALLHVARPAFTVRAADSADMYRLGRLNIEIEDATADVSTQEKT